MPSSNASRRRWCKRGWQHRGRGRQGEEGVKGMKQGELEGPPKGRVGLEQQQMEQVGQKVDQLETLQQ